MAISSRRLPYCSVRFHVLNRFVLYIVVRDVLKITCAVSGIGNYGLLTSSRVSLQICTAV